MLAFDFTQRGESFTDGSTRLQLDVPRYVDIYRHGRLKLDPLVSECFSLDQVNEAVASSKAGVALRNVIRASFIVLVCLEITVRTIAG